MNKLTEFIQLNSNKGYMDINPLIERLSLDPYLNKYENSGSCELFNSFTQFVIDIFDNNINYEKNLYRDWINARLQNYGKYMGKTKKSFDYKQRFQKDKELCLSIKEEGLLKPILIFEERGTIEIDGYHRLTIHKVLGYDKIKYLRREK